VALSKIIATYWLGMTARRRLIPIGVEPVPSAADPRLVDYVGLRDPQGRLLTETHLGCFIVEGFTAIERLLASTHPVRSIAALPARIERVRALIGERPITVYEVEREVLAAVAGFDLHRGVVASADRPAPLDIAAVLPDARLIVALEGLNDPENLGAIARTARAFGADALLVDATCADPWARRTVRVSMGQILSLPIIRSDRWHDDLDAARAAGFTVAALTPSADAVSLHRWSVPERVVLTFGAEGPGLPMATQQRADVRLRIPISPDVDSLNVGHAAAVVLAAVNASHSGEA
jgi:tRNA G18 (ribose-2'-O)-methylase SpoU